MRIRVPEGAYLAVLAVLPPSIMLTQFLSKRLFDFSRIDIPLQAGGIALAALLLFLQGERVPNSRKFRLFLFALASSLVAIIAASLFHGSDVPRSVVVFLGALLLIYVGGASGASIERAIDILAASFLVACLVALVIAPPDSGPVNTFGLTPTGYWVPLGIVTPWEVPWFGPERHYNILGQQGAFVMVWGLTRNAVWRIGLVSGGLLVVVLAGSRTSLLALIAGLAVMYAVVTLRNPARRRNPLNWVLPVVIPIALAVFFVSRNPTLTGRTGAWRNYLDVWVESPFTGVGDYRLILGRVREEIPDWANTAHNLYLDALTRHGILAAMFTAMAVILFFALSVSGVRQGLTAPISIFTVFFVGNLTEQHLDVRYWSVQAAFIVYAALLASTTSRRQSKDVNEHVHT